MTRQSLALFSVLGSTLLAAACGDSGSTSTSTGTTTSGSTTTTGTTGAGGSGGGTTTTTTTGTGGAGGGTTTTTTTGTGGAGGGGPMNACVNQADGAVLMSKDVPGIVGKCGKDNLGAEPATTNCIKTGTGLSDPCVVCFDATVHCVVDNCLNDCFSDANSPACKACRAEKCDPAFEMCSGLQAGG